MIDKIRRVFIVGIKGVAMAHLAAILSDMGKKVEGCDVDLEFKTDIILKARNIRVLSGFNPGFLPENTDLVIYSAAHDGEDNAIVREAYKKGVAVLSQPEMLNELLSLCNHSVGVCGTHGKTTSAALLSYSLIKLGAKPSYLVGAPKFNEYKGGKFDEKDFFIAEADEYGVNPPQNKTPKFHFLKTESILCTNIDFDHPDMYESIEEIKQAFLVFFKKAKTIIVCADDTNALDTAKKSSVLLKTYGYDKKNDLVILNFKTISNGSELEVAYQGKKMMFELSIFGEKNILNAAGALLTLFHYGYKEDEVCAAVRYFKGAQRRFELLYKNEEVYVFDDYAHHPNEIYATIRAARARFPNKYIRIIFQPHTFSRTKALAEEFGKALSQADFSHILPIFASARESTDIKISSKTIEEISRAKGALNIKAYESEEEFLKAFTDNITNNEVIFTMGAGNVYELADDIIEILKRKSQGAKI